MHTRARVDALPAHVLHEITTTNKHGHALKKVLEGHALPRLYLGTVTYLTRSGLLRRNSLLVTEGGGG